jgi:tyrosine-specific transport protein
MKGLKVFEAASTLMGAIIGAGILGIPYVIAKAGFFYGILNIVIIGLLVLFMNLCLGEIVLRTPNNHQLTGYAEKYLGKHGKRIMGFAMIFGIYGAMMAYLIGVGNTLSNMLGKTPMFFGILFFVFVSSMIYFGIKSVGRTEMIMNILKSTAFVVICGILLFFAKTSNLPSFNPAYIFLPYGAIIFAFIGTAAIPEMREELRKNEQKLKKAILIGSIVPVIFYILFALFVVATTGSATTEIATHGLKLISFPLFIISNIFAVLAMATAALVLGVALKETYMYDFHLKPFLAWALTCIIPFLMFFFARKGFIDIISLTGAIMGGLEGILIMLMHRNAKLKGTRNPEFTIKNYFLLTGIIILIFAVGIIYNAWMFIK